MRDNLIVGTCNLVLEYFGTSTSMKVWSTQTHTTKENDGQFFFGVIEYSVSQEQEPKTRSLIRIFQNKSCLVIYCTHTQITIAEGERKKKTTIIENRKILLMTIFSNLFVRS
jgi:hypothetical protein